MNSDCAFWIGKTHQICQDYVLAATRGGSACVLLADGCSSSTDTDIGARLLSKSAERLLPALPLTPEDRGEWVFYHEAAVHAAADCARRLDLAPPCLDATLMTIKAANGAFVASCYGDGVVALGRQDGTIEVSVISFAASYPQYASYLLDDVRGQKWEAQPANGKSVERWTLTEAGPAEMGQSETRASQAAMELFTGTAADYRFAAVLSDGVQSFARTSQTETSRATLPIAVTDVLADLLAFKGGQGQFVQRRVQAFRRDCQKRGWHHADDVAIGVVWLGD